MAVAPRRAGMFAAGSMAVTSTIMPAAVLAGPATILKEEQLGPQTVAPLPGAPPVELPAIPTDFPPLPDVKLPYIEQVTLRNGLRVFLLEDHELPLVRGSLLMRGGQRASPADRLGVATLSAGVQRAGGSVQHPMGSLDDALEFMAAYVEGAAGAEATTMGFGCASEDAGATLALFSEVIRSPALAQPKVDLYKAQIQNRLAHLDDNASGIPGRELGKLLYGRDSVFARNPTPEQVGSLQLADLRNYLARWERPDAAVFGVAGDFDTAAMKSMVEQYLGPWSVAEGQPPAAPAIPNPPVPPQTTAGTVYLIDRPGLTQATVALGELGVTLMDPDHFALDVLNDILNSFGGKLFDEIRSREGLAYSVSGGWSSTPMDHPGLFTAGGETAAPAEFLAAIQKVLEETLMTAPTAEEVELAKAQTINSFVFNFANSTAQLQRRLVYSLIGLPPDYLFQYRAGIEAVTPEDVLAAARRHLHPAQQTVVIIADAEASGLKAKLEKQGRKVVPLRLDEEEAAMPSFATTATAAIS